MAVRPSPSLQNAVAPGVRVDHIEPLQKRLERNRLKFVGFMIAFVTAFALAFSLVISATVGLLMLVGMDSDVFWHQVTPTAGAFLHITAVCSFIVAAVVCAAWALFRFTRSEMWLLERLGARMPAGGSYLATKSALRDMAIAAGLPEVPRFYVIDVPGTNAFVLGRSLDRLRVGVTRGMLENVPVDEQRAVFANLIARALAGDTLWATAVSALMGPVWALRDSDLRRSTDIPVAGDDDPSDRTVGDTARARQWRWLFIPMYGLAVIITELFAWYHQEAAWGAAEKADAEGMMLLKDPRSMLAAVEHVIERNNLVPSAREAYSALFFCWAGFGFAAEDDPEMRRVGRLRETLGAEGAAYVPHRDLSAPLAGISPRRENC